VRLRLVYGALFGIGKIILQDVGTGLAFLAVAIAAAGAIYYWDLAPRLGFGDGIVG
jgi:hypothetical protein